MTFIATGNMAPRGEEENQEKVEIQAPTEVEKEDSADDAGKQDNGEDVVNAPDDDDKKDTRHKMTVAADAPWSARMVRALVV